MSYALRFPTPTRRLGEPQPAMPTLNPGPGGWAEWASLLSTERRQLFPVGSAILTSAGTAAGSEAVPPPVIPATPGTAQSNGQNQNPSQSQSQSHSLPSTNGTAAPQSTAAPTNQRGMRQPNSENGAERDGAARGVSPAGVRSADDVDDADAANVNETTATAAAVAAVASAASGPSVMSTVVLQPTQCNVRAPLLPAHGAPMTKAFLSSGGVESIVRSLFSRAKSHLAPAAAPTVGGQRSPHNDDGSPNSVVAGGAKDVLPPRGVSPSQLSAKGSPASEFQDAAVSPPGMALPSAEALPCDNAGGVAGGGSGLPGPGAGARRFGPRTADIQHLTTILTACLQEPPQSRAEFVPQIARRLAQVATFVCNANLPSDEEATLVDALVTAVTALCRPIADFEAPEPPTTATVQRSGRTGTSGEKRPKRRSATAVADDDDADDADVDGVDLDADPEVDGEMLTVSQRDEEGRADDTNDRRTPGDLHSQRRTYDDDDDDDDDEGDATERNITGGGPGGRGSSGRGRSGFDAFARRNPGGVLKVTASAAPPPAVAASSAAAAGPKTPGVKVATFPSAVPAPPGRGGPNSRGSSPVGFHPPPPPTVSSFQQQGQQGQQGQQQGQQQSLPQCHHDRGPSPPNSATLRPTSSPYSAAGGAGGTPRGTPRGGGLGPTASSVTFDRNASSVYYPTTPGTPGSGAVPTESFASHLSAGGANAAARDRRNGPGVNSTSISRQHTFDGGFGATSTHDHNTDDEVGLLRDPNATHQTQHTAPAAMAAMRPPQRQHSIVSSVGGATANTANTHTTSWGSPMTPAGAAASLGLGGSFNRGYHGRGFASTPSPAARGASSTLQSVSNSVVLMPIALGGAAVVGPRARTAPTRRTTGSSAAGGATSTIAAAGDSVPTPPPPGRFGKAAGSSGGAGSSSFSLNFHLSLPSTAGLGKRRDALSRAERLAEWCVSRADETIAAYRDAKATDGHTRTVLHELIDNLREHYEVTDRDHHAVAVEAIEVEALWVRAEVEAAHDAAFTRLQLFHQSAVANDLDKTRAELRKKLERLTTRSQRAQLQLTSLETKMKKLTYAFPGCHDELMPRTSSRSPPPSSPVRDSPSMGPFGSPSTPNVEGGPTPARRDRRNSTTLAGAATPSAAARTPSGRGNVAPPALAANAAAVGASGKKRSDSASTPSSPDNASSIRRRSDSFGGDKHRISTIDPMRRERFEMEMKHMLAYRDQCEANAGVVAISSASVVGNSDTNAAGSVASPATPGARRELSTVVRGGKSSLRVPATSAQFVATLKSPNTAGPPPATSSFGHHAASATSAQGTGGHRLSVLRKKLADTSEIAAAAKKRTLAAKLCWSFTEALTRGTEECSSDLLECREKRVGSLIESAGRSLQESVSASKELVQQLNNGRAMFVEALESAPPISSVPETLAPTTPIVLDASLRDRVQSSTARAATASGGGGNGGPMPALAASGAAGLAGSGSLHRTASIASATSVMTSASALSASTVARDDPSPSGGFGSLAGGVGDTSAGSVSLPGGASVGAAVAQTPAYFGRAQFPDTAGASGARSPQFRSSASLSQLDEIEMTQSEAGDDGEGRTSGDSNLLSGGQRSAANDGATVGGSGTDRMDPSREKAKEKDKEKEKVIGARRAALRRPARQSGTPGPAPAGATSTTGSIAKGSVTTDAGVTPSPAPIAPGGANVGGKFSTTSAGPTSVLATPPPLSLPALLACVSRDFGFLEHAKAVLRMMVLTGEKAELQRNRMAVLTEMWRQEQGDADASVERLVHMRESTQKAFDALALLVESTREDALEVAHRELFTRLSRLHSPLISAGGVPGSATTDGSRTGTGGSGNSGGVGGGGFFTNSPSGGAPQLNASADNHHTFPQHPGGAGAHTASHGHSESSSMRRNTTDDLATVSVSTNETRTPGISGSVTRQPTPSLMQAGVHGGGAPNFGATVGPSDARASVPHGQGNLQDGGGGFGEGALSHRQDSNVSASTAPGTPGSISHHPHGLLGGPPVAPIPGAALGSPPGSIPTAGSSTAGHDGATHPPGSLGSDMHGAHQWGGSMHFQHTPSSLGMTSSSTANFMAGMITGSSAFSRAGSAAFGSPQTPGSAGPGAARRGVPKRLRKKMAELSFMHPAGAHPHPSHQGPHLPRASTGGTVGTVGTSHEDLSALHTGTTDLATGAPTTGSPNVDNTGVALAEQGSGGGGSGSALARGSNGAGGSGGSTADMTDGGTPGAGLVGLAGGVGVAHGGGAAGVGSAPAYGMSLEMSSWFTPQGSQMMQAMSFGPGTPGGPRGAAAAPWQGFMVDFLDAFQGPQTPVSVPPTPPREPKPQ